MARHQGVLRLHQGVLRDRPHRGPQEDRHPDAHPARRRRPDRPYPVGRPPVRQAGEGRDPEGGPRRSARSHRLPRGRVQRGPARVRRELTPGVESAAGHGAVDDIALVEVTSPARDPRRRVVVTAAAPRRGCGHCGRAAQGCGHCGRGQRGLWSLRPRRAGFWSLRPRRAGVVVTAAAWRAVLRAPSDHNHLLETFRLRGTRQCRPVRRPRHRGSVLRVGEAPRRPALCRCRRSGPRRGRGPAR